MKTHARNPSPPEDRLAKESFTFRRMKPWQIWTLGIVAVGGLALAILFG